MIYLFGDLHGCENVWQFDAPYFPKGQSLSKNDYVIILGDFGIPWSNKLWSKNIYAREMEKIEWLSEMPWTTLFLDGNHENFDNLAEFPNEELLGGIVGTLAPSVHHLLRGQIYTIENKTFFTFGGALSIDKVYRKPYASWWPQEEPSAEEMKFAMENLEKHNMQVDYILTHTASNKIFDLMAEGNSYFKKIRSLTADFLDIVHSRTSFKKWFFGHFHIDWTSDPLSSQVYYALMDSYISLDTATNHCDFGNVCR